LPLGALTARKHRQADGRRGTDQGKQDFLAVRFVPLLPGHKGAWNCRDLRVRS